MVSPDFSASIKPKGMKQFLLLIGAAVIGGIITLGGLHLLTDLSADTLPTGASNGVPARMVKQPVTRLNVPAVPGFNFVDAADRAMPAVVHITAKSGGESANNGRPNDSDNPFRYFFGDDFLGGFGGDRPRQGSGSGVIYTADGYVITNNHVVEFADEVEVSLYDNRTFAAEVIGTDPKSDLAVLKIKENGLPTMELANSDNLDIGEWVLAVGNPFELNSTVTAGIVSAKGRNISLLGGGEAIESFIQTDAAVNPGNSGGALVDQAGRLVDINTAIATRTGVFQGYSFAIPINLVKRIVDDIIKFGSYQRAFLGVSISELDSEYAEELGVDINQGVVIEKLFNGGSAQYAGLLEKDIVIAIDGEQVKSVPQLQEKVGRARVGDTVILTVLRRGKEKDIPVQLKAQMKDDE